MCRMRETFTNLSISVNLRKFLQNIYYYEEMKAKRIEKKICNKIIFVQYEFESVKWDVYV